MAPFAITANGVPDEDQEPIPVSKTAIAAILDTSISSDVVTETLTQLYSESAVAKIWALALEGLGKNEPPLEYPEYTEIGGTCYVHSRYDFWTSGFFPGCLYLLQERRQRWPDHKYLATFKRPHELRLKFACDWWTANLHAQALRTDTHDLGFMILPWARLGWELNRSLQCRNSLVTAAYSLASRFDASLGVIRSWDTCLTKIYSFTNPRTDFLVIIDSMMNLDLLFYVGSLQNDPALTNIATTHATTLLGSHIKSDDSTYHVINFDPVQKHIKEHLTNQGYSNHSCWARGQAWAIAGYAQSYAWTKDERFLAASKRLADYFQTRLPKDGVPHWDFDDPRPHPPRDTSAALIAAYGMLLIHENDESDTKYLSSALKLVHDVVRMSLAKKAWFTTDEQGNERVEREGFASIVMNATINNFEHAPTRFADHGLIYADYYFMLIGNKLLEMKIV